MPSYCASRSDDSRLWWGFPARDNDIIITARPKSGTTWVQTIVGMLIFQTAILPAPLHELSPWLDWKGRPFTETMTILNAQSHRRFIKTHSPLMVIPHFRNVTFITVARSLLDAALSSYYHVRNMKERFPGQEISLDEWMHIFIHDDKAANNFTQPLGVGLKGLDFAWQKRNQHLLVCYWDLEKNQQAEIERIACYLNINVSDSLLAVITENTGFAAMQAQATNFMPVPDYFTDPVKFFREGYSGGGRENVSARDYTYYKQRIRENMSPGAAAWLLKGER